MAKRKVSATLSEDSIARARAVMGTDNLSRLLEEGLEALIERELENRWLRGYADQPPDLSPPPPDLSAVPWDDG